MFLVFRQTAVSLAKNFGLIGGKLLAGDSTKFRAQNSRKNNFNQKKIDRHIAYIENKLEEYNKGLSENDGDSEKVKQLKEEVIKQEGRKAKYKELEKQIQETGQEQISTTDPESRQMIIRNNITEAVYNVQASTDSKHNIPIDYKVTNNNDSKAMGSMLQRAKAILKTNDFTALYDKGYHTGSEFKTAHDLGVNVLVAVPALPLTSQAPDPKYNVSNFTYNEITDSYICPEGQELKTTGTWHRGETYRFKQYKTKACKQCPVRNLCTRSAKNCKLVQHSELTSYIENNKQNIENKRDTYRRRQSIVEHPFGTIKRQWGFSYILTKKGINRAESDVGFMFIAYNLRRIMNIVGYEHLKAYLQGILLYFPHIYCQIKLFFSLNKQRKKTHIISILKF